MSEENEEVFARPIDALRDEVSFTSRRSYPSFSADEVQTALDEIDRMTGERDIFRDLWFATRDRAERLHTALEYIGRGTSHAALYARHALEVE